MPKCGRQRRWFCDEIVRWRCMYQKAGRYSLCRIDIAGTVSIRGNIIGCICVEGAAVAEEGKGGRKKIYPSVDINGARYCFRIDITAPPYIG